MAYQLVYIRMTRPEVDPSPFPRVLAAFPNFAVVAFRTRNRTSGLGSASLSIQVITSADCTSARAGIEGDSLRADTHTSVGSEGEETSSYYRNNLMHSQGICWEMKQDIYGITTIPSDVH
jgi:hypothetical protein